MNKVYKYKKSIIFVSIIVLTVVFALCFIGLERRTIDVEMDNNDYCYNLETLAYSNDIAKYPNVKNIATYNGEHVLPVRLAFNDKEVMLMNTKMLNSSFDYGYIAHKADKISQVDVYLITNIKGDVPTEWIPAINFVINGDILTVKVTRRNINMIKASENNKSLIIKMLIIIS